MKNSSKVKLKMDPYEGLQVRNYTIVEKVGKGKIGTVYKAIRSDINDIAACKVIAEGDLKDGWQKELEKVSLLRGSLEALQVLIPY